MIFSSFTQVRQSSSFIPMLETALRTTNLPANLKIAILIESVALMASAFVARDSDVLLYFVILVAFQGFCVQRHTGAGWAPPH